jgi:hypothetical protein
MIAISGQSLPIFVSGGLEFSYLGKDLDEADGEPEETLASITVRERTAEQTIPFRLLFSLTIRI